MPTSPDKHPGHAATFCECFGPCQLCEEWRAKQEGRTFIPATREVPKSTSVGKFITEGKFRGFTQFTEYMPLTKEELLSYQDDIEKIFAKHKKE